MPLPVLEDMEEQAFGLYRAGSAGNPDRAMSGCEQIHLACLSVMWKATKSMHYFICKSNERGLKL